MSSESFSDAVTNPYPTSLQFEICDDIVSRKSVKRDSMALLVDSTLAEAEAVCARMRACIGRLEAALHQSEVRIWGSAASAGDCEMEPTETMSETADFADSCSEIVPETDGMQGFSDLDEVHGKKSEALRRMPETDGMQGFSDLFEVHGKKSEALRRMLRILLPTYFTLVRSFPLVPCVLCVGLVLAVGVSVVFGGCMLK